MKVLYAETPKLLATRIVFAGLRVQVSAYINDWSWIKRTWRERLFSLPWKPREKDKRVFKPMAFLIDEMVIVSPQTYSAIIDLTDP